MWEMIVGELNHAMQEFARSFAHFLPRLLAMLIIALLGWVVAYVLKVMSARHSADCEVRQAF